MKIRNIFNFFKKEKNSSSGFKFVILGAGDYIGTYYSDPKLAIEGYVRNIIVYKCISLRAENVALMNFDLFNRDKQPKQIEDHILLDLLENPYPQMTKTDFLRDVSSYIDIYGNAYLEKRYGNMRGGSYKSTPPQTLFPLRSDWVTEENGVNQFNRNYKYSSEYDGFIDFPVGNSGKSNIIHIKNFNPRSYYHGLSPIVPAGYSIDQHNLSSKHNTALMGNGARPSGVLKVPKDTMLSDEQIKRLKADVNDKYSGSENTGKPLLLEGGMEWQEISINAKDGDFVNIKNTAAQEIGLAFNVPLELLNIFPAKYDNLKAAYDQFYSDAVIPQATQIINALNQNLVPLYDINLRLKANFNQTPVMMARKVRLMADLNPVTFLTANEKRKELGYEEHEDGNELKAGQSQIIPEANSFIEKEIRNGSTIGEALHLSEQIYGR